MKKNKKTLIAAIPLFLIVILVFAGFGVWKKYRDTLMQNQEEQMLLTTRILSENMAMSAEEYEESLSFLAKTAENRPQDEAKQLYREFIDPQTSFITNLYLEDEQGKLSESIKDVQIVSSQLLTQSSVKNSIYMEKDTDGKIYNVYKRILKDGRKICLMIDAEKYYQKLISGIHIGTNGYIVVKDAEGTIIMHPKKEQWGIPVIAGRKKMYPDLDYSSLEKMIEDQKKRKEGIDARNDADSMAFQIEQALKDVGDKIDANDKEKIEADLKALREVLDRTTVDSMLDSDIEDIKAAKARLEEDSQALFSKLYEQAQAAGAAGAGPDMNNSSAGADDDVVDGDYREV